MRVCSQPDCPTLIPQAGRCPEHQREAERKRGSSTKRGYHSKGHLAFRAAVLARNPTCVVCRVARSTVADHYPKSRKELIDAGSNADDPQAGRGVCDLCHNRETARHQPGGWNRR